MAEPTYTRHVDAVDSRPRQDGEPGEHVLSALVYPPDGVDSPPLEIRWYRDESFELYIEGRRVPASDFVREDDGSESFVFLVEKETAG